MDFAISIEERIEVMKELGAEVCGRPFSDERTTRAVVIGCGSVLGD
jgi:hypothetical protein